MSVAIMIGWGMPFDHAGARFKGAHIMLDTIKDLIHQNDLCVLATIGPQGPHTSLMAYTAGADSTELYLVTAKDTLKFKNMAIDDRVSLMIDTRDKSARREVCAITVSGRAIEITNPERLSAVRSAMVARHPQLKRLIDQPDVAWICVRIDAFQLLNGVHEAHHIRVSSPHD
jgi:nitroimidazol reductase NimA-like FMN-containing flavoprotein (pyridoxamine 5'-phosphate oxidase superfamily)